ncbi:hypothetical protein U1Q18_019032 [Sarracenia purpurea var. burkii]
MDKLEYIDNDFPGESESPMEVHDCPKLFFPCLLSPKRLKVGRGCTNVVLDSISNLNGLTSLSVTGNKEVICFPRDVLRNLALLESLNIVRLTKHKMLSGDLGNLIELKKLYINKCHELEWFATSHCLGDTGDWVVPRASLATCPRIAIFRNREDRLGNLTSLQSLHIWNCPKIVSLPASIWNLGKLQKLVIEGCAPELARRYQKETWEEWYNV